MGGAKVCRNRNESTFRQPCTTPAPAQKHTKHTQAYTRDEDAGLHIHHTSAMHTPPIDVPARAPATHMHACPTTHKQACAMHPITHLVDKLMETVCEGACSCGGKLDGDVTPIDDVCGDFSGSTWWRGTPLHKPIQPKGIWQPKMEVELKKMG
jgi:hypothetical protein